MTLLSMVAAQNRTIPCSSAENATTPQKPYPRHESNLHSVSRSSSFDLDKTLHLPTASTQGGLVSLGKCCKFVDRGVRTPFLGQVSTVTQELCVILLHV